MRGMRWSWREVAGAFGDLGVLVPIAVALIVVNGLSATAVLLPAGILYVVSGLVYRVPVPVQPLKAFGAIAIAQGLGSDVIAAGALLMGAIFVGLGATGLLDRAARWVPQPVIRGVQLSVGLLFLRVAWGLTSSPPEAFTDAARPSWWLLGGALLVALAAGLWRQRLVTLGLVALAVAAIAWHGPQLSLGPSALRVPSLDAATFGLAFTVLVLPQLPLTFANSCLATADVARDYFGGAARRVTPGRLATSLGLTNLVVGAVGGMPVCHGAGGMSAHRAFGARTGAAPVVMGVVLVALAVVLGSALAGLLVAFPLPVLAGLLAVAGVVHVLLLRDVRGVWDWTTVLVVGLLGLAGQLGLGLLVGLVLAWAPRLRARRAAELSSR